MARSPRLGRRTRILLIGFGVLALLFTVAVVVAMQRGLVPSRIEFIDPLANHVDASSAGAIASEPPEASEPSSGALATRVELPTRSSALEPDVTRLRLTARAPGLPADASTVEDDATDGPLEGARFELATRDFTHSATPIRVQHTVVASTGDSTVVELPATVMKAEVIASAPGYAPGRVTVDRLRMVDDTYRPSGLIERTVVIELTRHEPRRCLEGKLTVDGVPGAPDDLELALFLANGRPVRDAEFVVDRAANTYCLDPLGARPARLRVLGHGVVPLWLEIPDERPDGALILDVEMSAGRSAVLQVVDADSGSAIADHALRVEISIEAWRDSRSRGGATRLSVLTTDQAGVLTVDGLPRVGRLVVNALEPPRQLANGVLDFGPGEIYLDHALSADDPSVLRATIRIPTRPASACTLFGHRPDVALVETGELTLVLARTTDAGVRLTRYEPAGMAKSAGWELAVEPTGPVQAWLEREGRRASATVAFTTSAGRVGPIGFPLHTTTPVELSWSGGVVGDQLIVYRLGGIVDEELASLELESQGGSVSLELDGPSELGLVLARGETSLRRTLAWEPKSSDALHVDWPSTDVVDVRLDAEGIDDPISAPVLLVPIDGSAATASLFHLDRGRAQAQRVVPGRYFFRVEHGDRDVLICGVTEHVAGATELPLVWSGCPLSSVGGTDPAASVVVDSIGGVELSDVPLRLRTLTPTRTTDAESSRPSRLRLPCDCKWSPVRRPVDPADPSKESL